MNIYRKCLAALLCCLTTAAGAQQADTLSHTLSGVSVRGRKVKTFVQSSGGQSIVSMEMMQQMPRILGNADPLHYAQMLPGVQTSSEYDAGLHIQGCDNTHNMVSIGGVPIYNAAHLLGFFSVFNPTHFASMALDKTAGRADMAARLGGWLDMRHADTLATVTSGDLSAGPMSAQGTLRIPLGSKADVVFSARAAYLNLLYSRWLTIDDQQMRYSFCDYNMTYTYRPDTRNSLRIDAYYGGDRTGFKDGGYGMDATLSWSNLMAAAHWQHHTGGLTLEQSIHYTGYRNKFGLTQTDIAVRLPSDISDMGYKARLEAGRTAAGAEITQYSIHPQEPTPDGTVQTEQRQQPRMRPVETALWVTHTVRAGRHVELTAGLRPTLFITGGNYSGDGSGQKVYASADPSLAVKVSTSQASALTLSAAVRHQYVFKTGFSDIGLPTEFWIPAGYHSRPQYSYNTSLLFETLSAGRMWRMSAEVYCKWLRNQLEYDGNVFDFVLSDYDISNVMLHGHGYNYGAGLMLEKRKGHVTGWMSYTVGRAWRRFPGTKYTGRYPASHERIHELNAVATYHPSRRWNIGATMVAASGTPYTAPERFYVINNNIVSQFGRHNARRTGTYFRIDLSAGYDFSVNNRHKSGVNLSLYNVTMHSNPLFYRLKVYKDRFANKPFSFILRIMPSVNYYYSF